MLWGLGGCRCKALLQFMGVRALEAPLHRVLLQDVHGRARFGVWALALRQAPLEMSSWRRCSEMRVAARALELVRWRRCSVLLLLPTKSFCYLGSKQAYLLDIQTFLQKQAHRVQTSCATHCKVWAAEGLEI